jgi:hypothetical protein
MRIFLGGVLVVVVCYLAYTGMMAFGSWMKLNSAVDDIVSRDGVETVPARELKARVVTAANEAGVPLVPKDVVITDADRGVTVEVAWTVPVVIVNGDPVFAVPLTVRRTSGKR